MVCYKNQQNNYCGLKKPMIASKVLYLHSALSHMNMKSLVKILILTVLMFASTRLLQAQPHPNNGSAPVAGSNTPVGAGAPIADGQFLLLVMVMAYAGRKIYVMHANPAKESFRPFN
jgi:hypothetical protein